MTKLPQVKKKILTIQMIATSHAKLLPPSILMTKGILLLKTGRPAARKNDKMRNVSTGLKNRQKSRKK